MPPGIGLRQRTAFGYLVFLAGLAFARRGAEATNVVELFKDKAAQRSPAKPSLLA